MHRIQERLKYSSSSSPPTRWIIEILHNPVDGENLLMDGSLMNGSLKDELYDSMFLHNALESILALCPPRDSFGILGNACSLAKGVPMDIPDSYDHRYISNTCNT